MSAPKAPFVVRWRNGVMDDPNPALSWKALVAAMALTRFANVRNGRDCYPGAKTCARMMRVSEDTIHRGWAELVKAGWLEIKPLPASRRREQGALKVLRWPNRGEPTHPLTAGMTLTAPNMGADSGSTFTGNQGSLDPSEGQTGEAHHLLDGEMECSICGTRPALTDGLCPRCLGVWQSGDPEAIERLSR
jgi:hypothetical protein